MKKIYLFYIFTTIILNIYLIFGWSPYSNKNYNSIATYEYTDNNIDINTISNSDSEYYDDDFKEVSLSLSEQNLIENLSENEYKEINDIICNLSTSDLGKWIDLKNNSDANNIIEFFRVIQKRLSSEDYEKVRVIIGKIIDVDKVEVLLKNNYV